MRRSCRSLPLPWLLSPSFPLLPLPHQDGCRACVLSRFGAMESISSMKMMLGAFFSASTKTCGSGHISTLSQHTLPCCRGTEMAAAAEAEAAAARRMINRASLKTPAVCYAADQRWQKVCIFMYVCVYVCVPGGRAGTHKACMPHLAQVGLRLSSELAHDLRALRDAGDWPGARGQTRQGLAAGDTQ